MESIESKNARLKLVSGNSDEKRIAALKHLQALRDGHARLTDGFEKTLQPGMLVQWKAGMKNRNGPEYGEPRIVVEVLDEPIICTKFDSGSVYFREPLSLILGYVDDEGDFVTIHVDGRRFETYSGGDDDATESI